LDVEYITGKRAEPISFRVGTTAQKVRDDNGNHLTDIVMRFAVAFPDGDGGDAAREVLPSALQRSHDRLCTVSRTVELGASVTVHIDGAEELS
jgi:uncharacterized OsmC-like protein